MNHCRAKTTSALSGFRRRPDGNLVLFSILMNRLSGLDPARDAQDRMAPASASYSAATAAPSAPPAARS